MKGHVMIKYSDTGDDLTLHLASDKFNTYDRKTGDTVGMERQDEDKELVLSSDADYCVYCLNHTRFFQHPHRKTQERHWYNYIGLIHKWRKHKV